MVDTEGEPLRLALVPWLDPDFEGVERFTAMLLPAIRQALELVDQREAGIRLGLAIALPVHRPGLPATLERDARTAVASAFPQRFARVAILPTGHAGGLVALQQASLKVRDGVFDGCVVAGVESYLSADTLEWLEASDQLHGAGPLNNAWGFIPGEGAGAVLVVGGAALDRAGIDPLSRVASIGLAFEPNRMKTETVCTGEGLTAAFRAGLAGLPAGARVTDVYCDMNGEPYRADEFGFASLRTRESFVAASEFVAPADCWGDVSAASAPLGIVLSTFANRKGYANGPYALLWASSEGGERGAALIEDLPPSR
jgi:3-oxoacyl-[acyl-carrier-protein] synthase-1